MKPIKLIFCLSTVCCLMGCQRLTVPQQATQENYKTLLNGWLGENKDSLYQVWGEPAHDYWKENANYVIYIKTQVEETAQGATINRMPHMANTHAFYEKPQSLVTKSCTTLFKLEDGIISSWKFEGNACVAY